jgi:hypothetical protein
VRVPLRAFKVQRAVALEWSCGPGDALALEPPF